MKTHSILSAFFIVLALWGTAQNAAPNNIFVGVVKAVDPDTGQLLTYRISSGDPDKYFAIDAHNGTLTVSRSVYAAFTEFKVWKLYVTVSDNDRTRPLSSTAIITVILKKDTLNKTIIPGISKL